jgi:hypothetical protein
MLDDAFIRKLPVGLDDQQALLIEALVYSADAVELGHDSIQRMVLENRANILNPPRKLRLDIFMDVWTIVDCVHAARQMIEALNYRSPKALEFTKIAKAATRLRDKMDHLRDQSGNLSKAKQRPPLWGSLSYVELTPDTTAIEDDVIEIRECRSVLDT